MDSGQGVVLLEPEGDPDATAAASPDTPAAMPVAAADTAPHPASAATPNWWPMPMTMANRFRFGLHLIALEHRLISRRIQCVEYSTSAGRNPCHCVGRAAGKHGAARDTQQSGQEKSSIHGNRPPSGPSRAKDRRRCRVPKAGKESCRLPVGKCTPRPS